MKKYILPFLLLSNLVLMHASGQAPGVLHPYFTHYTTESGLISYRVNSSVQDADGYLWIATDDGLQRYDGIRYKSFVHVDTGTSSIPFKSIQQVFLDKEKNLWLLTSNGHAGIFNTKTFRYTGSRIVSKNEGALTSVIQPKKITGDEYGNLFLLIPGKELLTYNKSRNEFSAAHNFIAQKPGWVINDMQQQPGTNKYWMSLQGLGLACFHQQTNTLSDGQNNTENEKAINVYKSILNPGNLFFDSKQRLWLYEKPGAIPLLYCFDLKNGLPVLHAYRFTDVLKEDHDLRNFMEQQDGSIWIRGINIFAKFAEKEKRFEHVHNGHEDDGDIAFVQITFLMEDSEHNMWVGTANNGLFRFNTGSQFFSNITHINPATGKPGDDAPISFTCDSDGSILTGVWSEGLFRYDKNLNPVPLNIKGVPEKNMLSIVDMCPSKDSNYVWMVSQENIFKYNRIHHSLQRFSLSNAGEQIREIAEDKKGNLWIGMQNAPLYKWDAVKGNKNFADGLSPYTALPSLKVNHITVDRKGFVWIATAVEGVYVINPETEKIVLHFHKHAAGALQLAEEAVAAVLDYNDSLVLIATSTTLLMYNRLRHTSNFIGKSETTLGFIASVEKDRNGYVWVATNSALYRINVHSKVFVKFNRHDGIRNDAFILSASYTMPDGRILFGSTGTMLVFDPQKIKINTQAPDLRITDFKAGNRSITADLIHSEKLIELEPEENSLSIDVSTMLYNTNYTILYKMDGLDKGWKKADKSQQLTYTYMPAGRYRLLVNAYDAEMKPFAKSISMDIRVLPHFWETWWFYILLVLIAIAGLYWTDRERMKRKEAIQKMRSDIAANLHGEVSNALANINVLSEMARIKADKDLAKSKEFMELINTRSQNMIMAMDDMLWSIDPANDSMQKTIDRLLEHLGVLRTTYGVYINLLVDEKIKSLDLNMKQRQDIYWLWKSGITNMSRKGAQDIKMHIGAGKTMLNYVLEFDNSNMDMQQLNNLLQRQELEQKLKELKGRLTVNTVTNKTVIEVKTPLVKHCNTEHRAWQWFYRY